LLEVEVPERAEYIRLIAVELQRIASHLMWLGAYCPDIGNLTAFVYCLREREMMLDLLQELGGSRMHYNFPRIGGVKRDLPHGFAMRCRAKVKLFLERIHEYEALLDESTIFLIRTQGVGYAKPEEMVNHGVTGPNLRAGGVNYDVRWAHPYSVYDELDWIPSVERSSVKGADCYDRYRVRLDEMKTSADLVLQALDGIPGGADTYHEPGDPALLGKAPSRASDGQTGFHHFEDPRGESLFYIVGGGDARGKNPYRVSIRSPMFITIPYAAKCMIGYKIADVPAIMGSFDPCIGETDR
jgi:NADH-quinone oxidoreductase subunit D